MGLIVPIVYCFWFSVAVLESRRSFVGNVSCRIIAPWIDIDKILEIGNKYKFSFPIKIIPYKYIPETIAELSKDISII